MPTELTRVSCDDCGACCLAMTAPPGYTGQESLFFSVPEDEARFFSAPQDAQQAVFDWLEAIDAIPDGQPLPADKPCCWLDVETKRCRWYDHRSSVCREFRVGGEGCQAWRDEYNVDVHLITG